MDMRIKTMVLGHVQTNCYLVYEEGAGRGVIIDPADNSCGFHIINPPVFYIFFHIVMYG